MWCMMEMRAHSLLYYVASACRDLTGRHQHYEACVCTCSLAMHRRGERDIHVQDALEANRHHVAGVEE